MKFPKTISWLLGKKVKVSTKEKLHLVHIDEKGGGSYHIFSSPGLADGFINDCKRWNIKAHIHNAQLELDSQFGSCYITHE